MAMNHIGGGPTPVRFRDGSMHCMVKVVNPTGRTRFKGKFVCNSACGLPTKKPSRRCGTGGYGGGQMMQQYGGQRRNF